MRALNALQFKSTLLGGDVARGHSQRTHLRRHSAANMTSSPIWTCPSWSGCKLTLAGINSTSNSNSNNRKDRLRRDPALKSTASPPSRHLQMRAAPQIQAQVESPVESKTVVVENPDAAESKARVMSPQDGYESEDVHCDVLPNSTNCQQQQLPEPEPVAAVCEASDAQVTERRSRRAQRLATMSWDYLD